MVANANRVDRGHGDSANRIDYRLMDGADRVECGFARILAGHELFALFRRELELIFYFGAHLCGGELRGARGRTKRARGITNSTTGKKSPDKKHRSYRFGAGR